MISVGAIVLLLLLITLLIVVTITWSSYPVAKFVKINRNDSDTRYVAIGDIEIIDSRGHKISIINIEGNNCETFGTTATTATADGTPLSAGANNFPFINNGIVTKNNMKTGQGAAPQVVGPAMGGINAAAAAVPNNFLLYVLSCPAKIARINITAVPNVTDAARNLQNVKVSLIDGDRNVVKGSEKIIPYSTDIRAVHHFTYG